MRFILTLCMSIFLLVGCGSSEDTTTNKTDANASTTNSTSTTKTPPSTATTADASGVTPTSLGEAIGKAACACKTEAGDNTEKYNKCYVKATEDNKMMTYLLKYKPEQLKTYEVALDKAMEPCK